MKHNVKSEHFKALLVIALMFCCVRVVAQIEPTQPASGDGTPECPYQISSAAELYWFAMWKILWIWSASYSAKLTPKI